MKKFKDFISRFSFHTTPFTCEIRVEDHFVTEALTEPLEQLYRAVDKRMSAALIAPAGTGKTALEKAWKTWLPSIRRSSWKPSCLRCEH